ncbi:MAG: HVO_0476 family zinc finger protein [Halobacteriaceae archaeon]
MTDGNIESESKERIGLSCPACSPSVETEHEILAEGGGYATVKCLECQHVHKEQLPEAEEIERDVVVSQQGESFTTTVMAPRGETIARGEEFVLETEEAILEVRITDLQVDAEQRVEEATVEEIETIWTRAVDNVSVNVTINPSDGHREETRSLSMQVPGDYEFIVGESESVNDESFTVTGLHIRDNAIGYDHKKLDHDGDSAVAKDLKRVYGRDTGSRHRPVWG